LRDEGTQEDQPADRPASGDERDGQAGQRVSDDDDIAAETAQRVNDHVGVRGAASGGVLARKVRGDDDVAALLELGPQQIPAPAAVESTVYEGNRRHRALTDRDTTSLSHPSSSASTALRAFTDPTAVSL